MFKMSIYQTDDNPNERILDRKIKNTIEHTHTHSHGEKISCQLNIMAHQLA